MPVRKVYAPYSTSGEQIGQTPLQGYIGVEQEVRPIIDTGTIDEDGIWKGNVSSDTEFFAFETHPEIANGATFNAPSANADGSWPLDMTGYNDIQIALKPTNGGNYKVEAVMGSTGAPSELYANIQPLDAEALLYGNLYNKQEFQKLFGDNAQAMTADVWNIIMIRNVLRNCKLLQFKITNNSGDISTVETSFLRSVAN